MNVSPVKKSVLLCFHCYGVHNLPVAKNCRVKAKRSASVMAFHIFLSLYVIRKATLEINK